MVNNDFPDEELPGPVRNLSQDIPVMKEGVKQGTRLKKINRRKKTATCRTAVHHTPLQILRP